MKNKWVIIGCGGHARSIADVILYNDENADIIFLDQNAKEQETILGFPVVSNYQVSDEKVIVGIGNNAKRKELSQKYYNNLANVISSSAYVGKGVNLGKGIFIAHKSHLGVLSQVCDFAVINTGAIIDHECIINQSSFIGPNATLCGKVEVGQNTFLGAGASVIENIKIRDDVTVGAGSVVVKDIIKSGTYIGIPAKQKEQK